MFNKLKSKYSLGRKFNRFVYIQDSNLKIAQLFKWNANMKVTKLNMVLGHVKQNKHTIRGVDFGSPLDQNNNAFARTLEV